MERAVKERLVGAAVLMAAAIILIPEMLSGPDREPVPNVPTKSGEAQIKTYTIDLNQAVATPASASTSTTEGTAAPPPEIPAIVDAAPEAPAQGQIQGIPESTTPAAASPPPATRPVAEPPAPAVSNPAPPAASAKAPSVATGAAAPRSGAWAVQVGSFSKQATADRLAHDLAAQGQDAFVMPVKSGSGTLYRVRVGPMKDRASAEAALRKVKATVPGAAIVPHP